MTESRLRRILPAPAIAALILTAPPPSPTCALEPGECWLILQGLEPWDWDYDHDGDGFSAREEYAAGTDPFSRDSKLALSILHADPDIILTWRTSPGALYRLDSSSDLEVFDTGAPSLIGDGQDVEIVLDRTGPNAFVRLSALPPEDSDGDGLSGIEEAILGTDASDADTDGDGATDSDEVHSYFTDPLVPDETGGSLSGTVFVDPDGDGILLDGEAAAGVVVYLDANYNGRLDGGERSMTTGEEGTYQFDRVPRGLHHVRQVVSAPTIQSHPGGGAAPVFDLRPDEVVDYTHSAPGVGALDVPYGQAASDWPAEWGGIQLGPNFEEVSPDLVLKPLGRRGRGAGTRLSHGTEFLSLPTGASITVRFDEPIVDGPGPDFIVHPYVGGPASEVAELAVGPTADSLVGLGEIPEAGAPVPVDLADYDLRGPIHFVRVIGKDTGGTAPGYDLVGFEVLNVAAPDPDAHVVTITANESYAGLDFGRHVRDLPPSLVLSAVDGDFSTIGIRVDEPVIVSVAAFDDLGIGTVTARLNGQPLALDADGRAIVQPGRPGKLYLDATATDSGGHSVERSVDVYILTADGSLPFDAGQSGLASAPPDAPRTRILTPGPGFVSEADQEVVVEVIGTPAATEWTVEFAPVDAVDPYDLLAEDPDYQLLASGSGNLYSAAVATIPLSTLPDGIYFVRLCARNSPQRIACFGQVIAKNVPEEDLRPQVTITSPTPGSEVMVAVDITGTIRSARPLREWVVEVAPANRVDLNNLGADDPDWRRIGEGTGTIDEPGILATFDATVRRSESYVARVIARNDIGLGRVEPLALEVTGDAKLGRNRLEFRDLSVELAGFPLRFVRVYDSLQAADDGELGFGWSLDLQDADIRETVPDTGVLGLFGSTPFRDGTRVYITAPTGERLGFTFKPEFGRSSLFGSVYRATFVPDPGVYHALEVPEGDRAFLSLQDDGSVSLFLVGFPYNPETYTLTDPRGNRFTYHEDRGFLEAEDRNGNRLTLGPDGLHHSAGLSLRFERDAQNRVTGVIDPEGDRWTYAYDANGNLATVTDPDANTTTYTYHDSPAHYLASITDPLGRQPFRYEYDPDSGRLVATIDESGNRREVTWDPAGFTGTVTDARGNVTRLEYDARGNVTRRIDPLQNETRYEYADPANPDRETAVVDARGERYEATYNRRGDLVRYRKPVVTGIAGANRIDLTYDDDGNLTEVRDFETRRWRFTYDVRGNLVRRESPTEPTEINTYSQDGRLLSTTSDTPDAFRTDYHYSPTGQFAGLTDSSGTGISVDLARNGKPRAATNRHGNTLMFAYDATGIPRSQTDPMDNAVTVTGNPDGSHTRTNRYGNSERYAVATDGLLDVYTQPNGGTITPTYDENRNLATITDPLGNTTTFEYNAVNLPTVIRDPAGGAITVAYNEVGDPIEIVDRNGKRRTFTYDANRRTTAERWHDTDGNVVREIAFAYNGGSGDLEFITDTQGDVVHEIRILGGLPRPDRVRVAYHGQQFWNVGYNWATSGDPTPYPASVNLNKGAGAHTQVIATYYGGRSYQQTWVHPDGGGNRLEIRRDPTGNPTSLRRFTALGRNTPILESQFTYDTMGRLRTIRHLDGTGTTLVGPEAEITYDYDAENRIAAITTPGNAASLAYDAMNQLASVEHSNANLLDESYAYDTNGNRTASHLLAGPAVVATASRITAIGSLSLDYDAEGNVVRRTDTSTGEITNFGYDHRNRLVLATVQPSDGAAPAHTLRFDYDFLDRMISREIDGAKTWLLHDRGMLLGEFADGSTELNACYLYALDRVDELHGVWREGVGERWILTDKLGSVRGLTDGEGTLLSWVDYDAFGNLATGSSPANGEPLGFAARPFLAPIGLYDNRRRFYDPLLGRFTQEDPIRLGGGDINLYRYAFNDPCNLTDPFGTTAALEDSLLDALLTLTETLCKFGDCVGNLWSGVVRSVINVETRDVVSPAIDCAMKLVAPANFPPNRCDAIDTARKTLDISADRFTEVTWQLLVGGKGGEAGANATKTVFKIGKLIQTCSQGVQIEIEEVKLGCKPPAP